MGRMAGIAEQAKAVLTAPYIHIHESDNLCSYMVIRISLQPKEQWPNGIRQNSPHFTVSIFPTGVKDRWYEGDKVTAKVIELGANIPKFRTYTAAPEKVIAKVKSWLDSVLPEETPAQEEQAQEEQAQEEQAQEEQAQEEQAQEPTQRTKRPAIDKGELFRKAHEMAKMMRDKYESYREAFAACLSIMWDTARIQRDFPQYRRAA